MAIAWQLTITVIATVLSFSILYRYTAGFKFVEHTTIGISAGYALVLGIQGFLSTTWTPLGKGDLSLTIPIVLGILILTRLSNQYSWVSRWPMALMVGSVVGISIRAAIGAMFIKQIQVMFQPLRGLSPWGIFNNILSFILCIAGLAFFIFTVERGSGFRKGLSILDRIGRAGLMMAFGALFGATVLSRVAMVIGIMHMILFQWLGLR